MQLYRQVFMGLLWADGVAWSTGSNGPALRPSLPFDRTVRAAPALTESAPQSGGSRGSLAALNSLPTLLTVL